MITVPVCRQPRMCFLAFGLALVLSLYPGHAAQSESMWVPPPPAATPV